MTSLVEVMEKYVLTFKQNKTKYYEKITNNSMLYTTIFDKLY